MLARERGASYRPRDDTNTSCIQILNHTASRSEKTMQFTYQHGFSNHFASEALAGALPLGRNSPQRAPKGLYAEVLSGTAFTTPRAENRSSWLYKLRPSAMHPVYRRIADGELRSAPFSEVDTPPNRLRWNPFPLPTQPRDLVEGLATLAGGRAGTRPPRHFGEGLTTIAGCGKVASQTGLAVHVFRANRSMSERCFWNADGELMLVPQQGGLVLSTELGKLSVAPGEIAVVPRGMKFRVELADDAARGYVCENYGQPFRLPELGPIGSQGLAQQRDFQAPGAAFEDRGPCEVVAKFMGGRSRARCPAARRRASGSARRTRRSSSARSRSAYARSYRRS